MRIPPLQILVRGSLARRGRVAFTLTETLVASSVFLFVIGAILVANTFGMRMVGITQPKLAAGGEIRNTMAEFISDIRSAKFIRIGNGTLAGFTNIVAPNPKEGNAIQLYATADTNVFVRFFRDAADQKLKRTTDEASATIVANSISNDIVFRAEYYDGTVLTNEQNNMVIGITLQFYELDGTATPLGSGNYYKSYSVTNRVAHRAH
jgi:hypothetical protein